MLTVCETFVSIQGESTYAGEVCAFVRLSGCNLSCGYCDTRYAFEHGKEMPVEDIVRWVKGQGCNLVEITGGEPLMQRETAQLADALVNQGHRVLVETNGSYDISVLPRSCVKIVDVKCPGSDMAHSFFIPNLKALTRHDECKFVISNKDDFVWSHAFVNTHRLADICTVIFSPNTTTLKPKDLAEWIIEKKPGARLGLQLHKCIWGEDVRGR
jgi:7-carboxy-7-deazaguanine synthase